MAKIDISEKTKERLDAIMGLYETGNYDKVINRVIDKSGLEEPEEEEECNCPSMAEDMGIENLPLSNKEDMD